VVVALSEPGSIGVGEPVYGLSAFDQDGAAAEYVTVSSANLSPKPMSIGHIESAAVPLAALSAWQGLFVHGMLEPGQRVLIHGAAGGVGAFAVQLAHHRGAQVIGTASAAGADLVIRLGADSVIDPTKTLFMEAIGPVDLVFDTAGGERLRRSPTALRQGGRLVSVAEEPSTSAGITAVYFVVEPNREQLQELTRLIDEGHLRPIVDKVYPLAEARRAFERSLGTHGAGKIVLRVADEDG
jgi:NADPH:quinone reductase-like Zn-dependent oxidoreductase